MTTFENEYQWDVVDSFEYYGYTIELSCCMDSVFSAKVLNNDGSMNANLTPIFNEDVSKETLIEKCEQAILEVTQ